MDTAFRLRHQKAALLFVNALFLVSLLLSCGKPAELRPAKRPSAVPASAVWAGGADGGAYVQCAFEIGQNVDECSVWNDYTGQLVESGKYMLSKERRAATVSELKVRGADFDGSIFLQNGLVLRRQ
jgi:hypothetical protein